MIRRYLSNLIDEHKNGWKIRLAMEVTFVSVIKDFDKYSNKKSDKDSNESCAMHIQG